MNSFRILVIDDSASTCFFIATALQQAGYAVETTLNGRQGLARAMTFHPHCLILDVLLPDISGYALCRQIRQSPSGRTLPLILMSSKGGPLDVRYGLRQGADRYLSKPFPAETLLQTVREVIPESFRHPVSSTDPSIPSQPALPTLSKLVPRRVAEDDVMLTSNPFTGTSAIRDKQARRLYGAIDGRKTVGELTSMLALEAEEMRSTLRILLQGQHIQVYTLAGHLVERPL
jgi:DNA-binding response OmpR family regulator